MRITNNGLIVHLRLWLSSEFRNFTCNDRFDAVHVIKQLLSIIIYRHVLCIQKLYAELYYGPKVSEICNQSMSICRYMQE